MAEIFNLDAYRTLEEYLGKERALEFWDIFLNDAKQRFDVMLSPDHTAEEVKRHLHSMIACSGSLGFLKLSALCRQYVDQPEDVVREQIQNVYDSYQEILRLSKPE